MSATPPLQGKPKPPKAPKTPRVSELLRKAIEWQQQLDSGEVKNQAEIARRLPIPLKLTRRQGITRARVTQAMNLLQLDLKTRERILTLPGGIRRPEVTERRLRSITSGIELGRRAEQLSSIT